MQNSLFQKVRALRLFYEADAILCEMGRSLSIIGENEYSYSNLSIRECTMHNPSAPNPYCTWHLKVYYDSVLVFHFVRCSDDILGEVREFKKGNWIHRLHLVYYNAINAPRS
ncbi:hypothetical protein IKE79_00125 [Candidatus Saccharibacteria bacterium]|nr:hypothetical protein [Candidatus Saccharibacteria bacterium]